MPNKPRDLVFLHGEDDHAPEGYKEIEGPREGRYYDANDPKGTRKLPKGHHYLRDVPEKRQRDWNKPAYDYPEREGKKLDHPMKRVESQTSTKPEESPADQFQKDMECMEMRDSHVVDEAPKESYHDLAQVLSLLPKPAIPVHWRILNEGRFSAFAEKVARRLPANLAAMVSGSLASLSRHSTSDVTAAIKRQKDQLAVQVLIAHTVGHAIDGEAHTFSESKEWKRALKAEQDAGITPSFDSIGAMVENFADSIVLSILRPEEFEHQHQHLAQTLHGMLDYPKHERCGKHLQSAAEYADSTKDRPLPRVHGRFISPHQHVATVTTSSLQNADEVMNVSALIMKAFLDDYR